MSQAVGVWEKGEVHTKPEAGEHALPGCDISGLAFLLGPPPPVPALGSIGSVVGSVLGAFPIFMEGGKGSERGTG